MSHVQAPVPDPVSMAVRERRVVELRARGFRPHQIVAEVAAAGGSVDLKEVKRILRDNAEVIREKTRSLSAARFVRADTILATLIDALYRKLLKGFDKDMAKALVSYLDRQARMLGLDAAKTTPDDESWLDGKSNEELVVLIREQYKLPVPDDILDPRRDG